MTKTAILKMQSFSKYLYIIFTFAAIVFICVKDFTTAIIFACFGLAFDPFNQTLLFNKRPLWQRVWLIVHLVVVLIILWITELKR